MPGLSSGVPAVKARSGVVTLTSDFGTADSYVGAMKGVILTINPRAALVDITHEIRPQGVWEAAFVLQNCAFQFPYGTVHLVVVDPGVGSRRRLIVLEEKGQLFVAPDNGILSLVASKGSEVVNIDLRKRELIPSVSSYTFHGRDILAPVAAHLSLGRGLEEIGRRVRNIRKFVLPSARRLPGGWRGEIIYTDRFGNLVTNLAKEIVCKLPGWDKAEIEVAGVRVKGIKKSYYQGRSGELMAVIGSHNFLELAVKNGSAREKLKIKEGEPLWLRIKERP